MEEELEKKEENTSENSKKQSNQLKWVLGIMGVFVLLMLVFLFVGGGSQAFEYKGLNWNKENFGDLPIYTTLVTGYSITGKPIDFKMPFRNDPRQLDIPVDGEVNYIYEKPVYVSLDFDSGINECGTLGLINLGRFMAEMRLNVISSVTSQNWSDELETPLANCENLHENTVFILTQGSESKIEQDKGNPNCYRLIVSQCEDVE